MGRTLVAATLALLLWGTPVMAGPLPDADSDGVSDSADNCSDDPNPAQDDTDGDDCGNLCDADYDGTGLVGFIDFSGFSGAYGTTDLQKDHTEPVTGPVGFIDFSFFSGAYAGVPGPSGTTTGTTACP